MRYELYKEAISNESIKEIVNIDGSHYLHWSNAEKIAKMTKELLEMKKAAK